MVVGDQDRAYVGDGSSLPGVAAVRPPQDRANALGQRSGECPLCSGGVGPYPEWDPEQVRRGMGANHSYTLWGDRMRAGGKAGPRRSSQVCSGAGRLRVARSGTINARSRGRRCGGSSGRRLRRLLEPGCSAAPGRHCLALLPSGPDAVRRLPMRGTWLSTLRAPAQTPDDSAPRAVLGPAIADCGRREPLAPRLARPGRKMVAARSACPRGGPVSGRGWDRTSDLSRVRRALSR